MKLLFILSLLCLSSVAKAQGDDLIGLALSDKSNFEVMSWLSHRHRMPKKIYVFDTTDLWRLERFQIDVSDPSDPHVLTDEHHPYHHTYLFKDSLLQETFGISERDSLLGRAQALRPRKVKVNTPFARSIGSYDAVRTGFILRAADPVFSTDGHYAFLDFTILEKAAPTKELNDAYHSTVCLVYKKEGNTWKRWMKLNYLIL